MKYQEPLFVVKAEGGSMYIKGGGGRGKKDRLLEIQWRNRNKSNLKNWMENVFNQFSPSICSPADSGTGEAAADLPSRPSLPVAWGCLKLGKALSPKTFSKMT